MYNVSNICENLSSISMLKGTLQIINENQSDQPKLLLSHSLLRKRKCLRNENHKKLHELDNH